MWQAISAFARKPTRVFLGVRKLVYAAWLVVLFLLITQLNPVPYLGAAGFIAALLLVFKLWDRATSRAPDALKEGDDWAARPVITRGPDARVRL